MTSTPAERYAQARHDRQYRQLAEFADLYDFTLDPFQKQACRSVEDGHGVLVAAPTGSGKTLVGEFAVHLALATGGKCFYTTPIKALSNQKFHDLTRRYGADHVGLLTGDNSINGDAPIIVMTTEVLRNMLYAGSSTLTGLSYVVMDEVHYLADRFRGAVWEEVIIHLPESVSVISLSATVSNAEEFGDWLTEVRGDNVTIVEERRPVPLYQHVLVGNRMYPLFEDDGTTVNTALERLAREDAQVRKLRDHRGKKRRRPRTRFWPPGRGDIVRNLDSQALLPAIVFIFSRAGCAQAVSECVNARITLTTREEREYIIDYVSEACRELSDDDLYVLGYHDFVTALSNGVAAHHAGMLPLFKECVEHLFSRGLVKVVFATETLALGINMPARSVVIERLSKWNGQNHADITAGEYTQLTGRAGRRGIDVEGHGVVVWQAGFNPRQVAGLASTRTYPLNSSFHPSYNMAVNLVDQVGRAQARQLLEQSFAQFQADRAVVGLARQIRQADEALEGYRDAFQCDFGDFMEYAQLRRDITAAESKGAKRRKARARSEVTQSLRGLKRGDIIDVPAGKWAGFAVVLDPGRDDDEPRPFVLTASRHARRLAHIDFPVPVHALGRMRIPKTFHARNAQSRRDLASTLRHKTEGMRHERGRAPEPGNEPDPDIEPLREQMRDHPCHQCPNREDHARWAQRYFKLESETRAMRERITARTNTVARQFDRVCGVLGDVGYLDGDRVNEDGIRLQRLYSELDLLAAECLRLGIWDDLDEPSFAAALSGLTFESRTDEAPLAQFPTREVAQAAQEMESLGQDLAVVEKRHKIQRLRAPDFGFAEIAWQWAGGASLDEVLMKADMPAGDFVRSIKQVIDLAAQVADAAGDSPIRGTARRAVDAMRRGILLQE